MKSITLILIISSLLASCTFQPAKKPISIQSFTVNYFTNPLGLDDPEPSLTWVMTSPERNKRQSAYHIKVATSKEKLESEKDLIWNTGKINSSQNAHIRYAGEPLLSGQSCFFQIRVWDENDQVSDWSEVGIWSMGLLNREDWKAKWIGYKTTDKNEQDPLHLPPTPYFRKTFEAKASIKKANLYVTSLGVFEMSINGKRVGQDLLTPGWTDYNKRIYYKSYDIKQDLNEGENTLGAIVGDGWYAGYVGPKELSNPRNRELYGLHPALLCQLEIEYENGEKEVIVSDESWKASEGAFVFADLLMGVTYNANLEEEGWAMPDFDDQDWDSVYIHQGAEGALQAYPGNSIQVYDELLPIEITEQDSGKYIFNLGQNFAGHARIKVKGDKGDTIVMRYGERLREDGSLMTENLRFARATDTYILKGKGTEVWEPKFTYHGFQYVEVSGLGSKPDQSTITGVAFGSSIPMVSSFTSSDEVLNKMYQNIIWTQRSNFMEVPTDSPQRDERLGWLGDVQIFSRSALYNATLGAFNQKWFTDVRDAQYDFGAYSTFAPRPYPKLVWYSPGWMEAGVMVPYNTYKFYGDTKIIEDHYESMTKFIEYHIKKSAEDKFYPEHSWTEARLNGGFGDWLEMTEKHTAHDLMASLYYHNVLRMMSEMSAAIGQDEKAAYYKKTYDESVEAFIDHYVNVDGKFEIDESMYGDGKGYFEGERGFTGHSQSAYATAIYFDILPKDLKEQAGKHLTKLIEDNNGLPSSGILGIRQLLPALSAVGKSDVAFAILLKKDYPSWGFQVEHGASTIWERWNSWTPDKGFNGAMNAKMNSFNHYAFGAFGQYLFSNIAGIDQEGVGFKNIIIKPELGNSELTYAQAEYGSINGVISSSWKLDSSNYKLHVQVPVHTTAKVYILSKKGSTIKEGGQPIDGSLIKDLGRDGIYQVLEVGSGEYSFESDI